MFLKGVNHIFYLFSEYSIIYMFAYILLSRLNFIFDLKCSLIFICFISIFITFFFQKIFFKISNIFKNTFFFNYLLYSHLLIKEFFYKIFIKFIENVENLKYKKLMYFQFFFNITFLPIFILYCFFYINENIYYNILLIILLINSLLNLVEKNLIFNSQNIDTIIKKKIDLDFKSIQNILKIQTSSFNKNHKLIYTQKRHINFKNIKEKVYENLLVSIAGTTIASIIGSVGIVSTMIHNNKRLLIKQEDISIKKRDSLIKERDSFIKEREGFIKEKEGCYSRLDFLNRDLKENKSELIDFLNKNNTENDYRIQFLKDHVNNLEQEIKSTRDQINSIDNNIASINNNNISIKKNIASIDNNIISIEENNVNLKSLSVFENMFL